MLTMYQQITIQTLFKQGHKKSEVARELGCHRNTVRNIIKREKLIAKQTRDKPSFFDTYAQQIKDYIQKKISKRRIYELLQENYGLTLSYDSLCKYIQLNFPKPIEAYGVQITAPGEEAEVDFGYAGLQPVNTPGAPLVRAKTWFLVVKLSYSRVSYHEITHDQKVSTLISGIENSFAYFGGIPKKIKVDNLRAVILKNQHFDLLFNQDFLEWAKHEGCVISPCAPYQPEQKGKVEGEVKYVSGNFFAGRTFTDGADLDRQLGWWTREYANIRIHGVTKRVPLEVLKETEQACLMIFPENPFTFFERAERIVSKNCHVFFQNNYYSVPAHLIGKTVTLRFGGNLLRIIYTGEEVACHLQSKEIGKYITTRDHLPDYKCYSETEYQKRYENKMITIGEFAHLFFKELLFIKEAYWFQSIRQILGLAHEYGNEAVNLSLERALKFKVTNIPTIRNIVRKKLYLLPVPPRLLSSPPVLFLPLPRENTACPLPIHSIPEISPVLLPLPILPTPEVPEENIFSRDLSYYQNILIKEENI